MTISDKYFTYLERFSKTEQVSNLYDDQAAPDIICLRHDIDHDLDVALDLAYHEYKRGFRATYYVLHDHEYNHDPLFFEKLLQLQDYGHEIGVHCNLIAGWLAGRFDEPRDHLLSWLCQARSRGLAISGTSTHGDSLCYEFGVLNSWVFSQQFKSKENYMPVSAEGVPDPTNKRNIDYPDSRTLVRQDGATLDLWSCDMDDFGLVYEAVDLSARYWSDTGKDWHRTGDPLDADLSSGRHQVLMHPIHWLAEPRNIFFVSTARVGSKWTADAVASCTSANVVHEWTLNHRQRYGKHVHEKITTFDTRLLEKNEGLASNLINYASRYHARGYKDFVEFNVYLVDYLDKIVDAFPNAEIYGLAREGRHVVASLLSRNWYASSKSPRYPYAYRYSSQKMTQFQRVCRYWVDVNQAILDRGYPTFKIEEIGKDTKAFQGFIESLGMPVHQRLIDKIDFAPKDKTIHARGMQPKSWTVKQRLHFFRVCRGTVQRLGYVYPFAGIYLGLMYLSRLKRYLPCVFTSGSKTKKPSPKKEAVPHDLLSACWWASSPKIFKPLDKPGKMIITDGAAGWVLIGRDGGAAPQPKWNDIGAARGLDFQGAAVQVDGAIKFNAQTEQLVRVFILGYDQKSGQLLDKKILTQLTPGWRGVFSEVIPNTDNPVLIGIHVSPKDSNTKPKESFIEISQFSLKVTPN